MQPKKLGLLAIVALVAALVIPAFAADLSYSTLIPQDDDSTLVRQSKRDLAAARVVSGSLFTNITAPGTNTVQFIFPAVTNITTNVVGSVTNISTNVVASVTNVASVLRAVYINSAGTASQIVLKDGSTTIATLPTTTAGSWLFNIATTNGLNFIYTAPGGTNANITLGWW
jgi:hypothetical protein